MVARDGKAISRDLIGDSETTTRAMDLFHRPCSFCKASLLESIDQRPMRFAVLKHSDRPESSISRVEGNGDCLRNK